MRPPRPPPSPTDEIVRTLRGARGAWKVGVFVGGILIAGFGAAQILQGYVKHEQLERVIAAQDALRDEVRELREAGATRATDIAAIKRDMSAVRDDVRTLLTHMLAEPPRRDRR